MIGSTFIRQELATQLRDTFRAIDNVLVAAPTLHHALKAGHVPFGRFDDGKWISTPLSEGVARYGNSLPFAIWQQLRAIEALRVSFTGTVSAAIELPPEEPDEAPGLAVEKPSTDEGAEQQRRLVTTGDD